MCKQERIEDGRARSPEADCELPGVGYRRGDGIAPFLLLVVADSNEQCFLRARAAAGRNFVIDGHRGGGGRVRLPEPRLCIPRAS
jgi:hypothetical protein